MDRFKTETLRKLRIPTNEVSAWRKTKVLLGCGLTLAYTSWSAAEDYRLMMNSKGTFYGVGDFQMAMLRTGIGNIKKEVLSKNTMCDRWIELQEEFRQIVGCILSYGLFPLEMDDFIAFCKLIYDTDRLPRFRKQAAMEYALFSHAVLLYMDGGLSESELQSRFVHIDINNGREQRITPMEFRTYWADVEDAMKVLWEVYQIRRMK